VLLMLLTALALTGMILVALLPPRTTAPLWETLK
jgi:hypothetical protein